MAGWLLAISRDTELTRALAHVLIRNGSPNQLWAVDCPERARQALIDRESLPAVIVVDELFLREEPLASVAEEFSWYAPLVLVAKPAKHAQLASLIAEGKADLVPRGDYFTPLAAALVERSLRWEREIEQQIVLSEWKVARTVAGREGKPDEDGFPTEALRSVGAILDSLERVLSERSQLPLGAARRLERITDLAFDLKQSLRLLAGLAADEDASRTENPISS
jgi:hypothetical protein